MFDSLPSSRRSASKPLESSQATYLGFGSMRERIEGFGKEGQWGL